MTADPIWTQHVERCACPACLTLDARWPDDGWQMKLFAASIMEAREPRISAVLDEADDANEADTGPDLFSGGGGQSV